MNSRGQVSTEYILLVAFGLVLILVGIAVALQVKSYSDSIGAQVAAERAQTLNQLATNVPTTSPTPTISSSPSPTSTPAPTPGATTTTAGGSG